MGTYETYEMSDDNPANVKPRCPLCGAQAFITTNGPYYQGMTKCYDNIYTDDYRSEEEVYFAWKSIVFKYNVKFMITKILVYIMPVVILLPFIFDLIKCVLFNDYSVNGKDVLIDTAYAVLVSFLFLWWNKLGNILHYALKRKTPWHEWKLIIKHKKENLKETQNVPEDIQISPESFNKQHKKLLALHKRIDDPEIREEFTSLLLTCKKLSKLLNKCPDKISYARKIIAYYNEQLISMIKLYFKDTIPREEIVDIIRYLNPIYEHVHDQIVDDEQMNAIADLKVLKSNIKDDYIYIGGEKL